MLVSAAHDLAMRLFHERGFGSVGVDLIGESAGMSGPAIDRYFSGKEEILVVLLDEPSIGCSWQRVAYSTIPKSSYALSCVDM